MTRKSILAVVLFVFASNSTARSQDTDEVKRFKDRIELLEAKLKLAEIEIAQLKGKQPGGDKDMAKQQTLSDLLPEGTVLTGTNRNPQTNKTVPCSITITKRDGKKYEATTVAGAAGAVTNGTIEGTITGNSFTVKSVGAADAFTGTSIFLKGKTLEGTITYTSGLKQVIVFTVIK